MLLKQINDGMLQHSFGPYMTCSVTDDNGGQGEGLFVLCGCSLAGLHQHCHQASCPSHWTAAQLTAAALNC